MSEYRYCKHLDFEDNYSACELVEHPMGFKYWKRLAPPYEGAPVNVQFCKRRGRINSMTSCLMPGGCMSCFEGEEDEVL